MIDIVSEWIKGKMSTLLAATHADTSSLLESARAALNPVETFTCPLSPAIGAHVGPGTLVLNYMSGIE